MGDTRASERGQSQPASIDSLSREQAQAALAAALEREAMAAALVYANRVVVTGGAIAPKTRGELARAIDELPREALERVYGEIRAEVYPAPLIALRVALITAHLGEHRAAADWLERSSGAEATVGEETFAELRQRIQETINIGAASAQPVDSRVIVAALPMSGSFAPIGAELAAALGFAARQARADSTPGRGIRFEIVDTRGEPDGAVAAVERAVYHFKALAMIGPVGDRESLAAARRAAELGMPIALLAPGVAGSGPRARVFRLWSSPAWEAREAARLAIALGYDRLAVLAPRDELGELSAGSFAEVARELGVRVVARGFYDPTASALEPDIKAFLGLEPATNERLRRHLRRFGKKGWKTFSPDVPFDLLYIPDQYQRAALVASFLPYFNVETRSRDVMDAIALRRKHRGRVPQVVQLLGSSSWHHDGLIPRGGPAIEGALVVEVFSGGENEEYATEDGAAFAQSYHERVGRLPSALSAQAYDAALLVLAAARQAAPLVSGNQVVEVRRHFARALAAAELDAGACGPARVGATGNIEREAVLLRVDGGGFVLHEY